MHEDIVELVQRVFDTLTAHAACWHREVSAYVVSVVEHLVLCACAYAAVCVLLYALIVRWRSLQFDADVHRAPHRVLFVTAHPDDETMFFGPTLLRFTRDPHVQVYVVCLSMNRVRKQELFAACRVLGVAADRVLVHSHTLMPDALGVRWPAEVVARIVSHHLDALDIDTLITFDRHGVSRHANHCSIYYGVALLSTERRLPPTCRVYVLETINVVRKYWRHLDIPVCYALSRIRFITSSPERRILREAMTQHKSQYVWFRRLYMRFSRYQLINTLQRMDVADIQLDLDTTDDDD